MARARNPLSTTWKDDIRHKKIAEVRERTRKVAEIVVRLPADRSQVPESEARSDLLSEFGLTAAMTAEARTFDAVEFVAETADHYALWFGQDGPSWIRDEHYSLGREEILQIAAEELERARRQGADH